jgi:outer membrane lipoprotein LolB
LRQSWTGGLCAAILLLLHGCAQLPGFRADSAANTLRLGKAPQSFQLEGRVSVKSSEENFSGGMLWNHDRQRENLLLRTPLGQGVAELQGSPGGVSLKDADGRLYQAEDAEQLVRQVVGMTLPMKGLAWWVVGHPRPNSRFSSEADERGRLSVLKQDGWRIEFSRYGTHADARQANVELPGKLVARGGEDLEIRLVVDRWELP